MLPAWPKHAIALAAIWLLAFAAAHAADKPPVPAPSPRLVIDSPSLDLGQVPEGEEVTAEFVVQNAGEAELKILKAKPS